MKETISIKEIFISLKKHWKLIIGITMLAALCSVTISYYVLTPVYQASTQILVSQKDEQNRLDASQVMSSLELINTYSVIIKSPVILDKVINDLNLTQSVEQLNKKIKVTSEDNSLVFSISVEDESAEKAINIANAISETFQQDIRSIMNVDNVSILSKPELKDNLLPIKPKPIWNIAMAIIVGFMSGIGLALLIEYFDNTIKDGQDVEAYLGLPVLGSIQKIKQEKGKKYINSSVKENVEGDSFET